MLVRPDIVRTPPHNFEAEQALLGAILLNNRSLEKVGEFLRPEHFADPTHGRIFGAAAMLIERGQIANPVTLKTYFESDGGLAEIGGTQYLAQLANAVVSIINAKDYGKLVHDLHLRRGLIALGEDIVNDAYEPQLDTSALDVVEAAEARLSALAECGQHGGSRTFNEIIAATAEEAATARQHGGGIGLATGLVELDDKLCGLAPGNLLILGGRPAMGKSAIGFCIAQHVAATQAPVGAFSLEMRGEEIGQRLAGDAADVPYSSIRKGDLDDMQWERFQRAKCNLAKLPLHIDDTAGLTIDQIRARARRMRRRHGVGLVVVDHLHLIRGKAENRLQELTRISAGLKEMARELNIPVIALCQLNRGSEQRDDRRPQLSDLRESGTIEQDADQVAFVYRPVYYLERAEPTRKPGESDGALTCRLADWHAEVARERNRAEVIIAKNRHGATGTANVYCDLAYSRFLSLAPDEQR